MRKYFSTILVIACLSGLHSTSVFSGTEAMTEMPRLLEKRTHVTTGKEDFSKIEGFGKDAPMAQMMNLMMVEGSGMEDMDMEPMPTPSSPPDPFAPENNKDSATANQNKMPKSTVKFSVQISPNPPVSGKNTLVVVLTDPKTGLPVDGAKLFAVVSMASMDMGQAREHLVGKGSGRYEGVVSFGMAGSWSVTLTGLLGDSQKTAATLNATLIFSTGTPWKNSPQ